MSERITGVAILDERDRLWSLPPPHRHHSIFALAAFCKDDAEGGTQGFTTSAGRFVDRKEARRIAEAAGQEPRRTGTSDELFSEDLW